MSKHAHVTYWIFESYSFFCEVRFVISVLTLYCANGNVPYESQ